MTEITFGATKKVLFRNLANIVTILGIIGAIWLLVVILAYPGELWLVLALAVFVGITDFVDGRIARYFNNVTFVGGALDRLRDKIFICPNLIILVWQYWPAEERSFILITLAAALVIFLVIIEILLLAGWIFGLLNKKDIQANRYGKIKMFLQFIIVMVWLVSLTIGKYAGVQVVGYSLYLINVLLVITIYFAIRSLEKYYLRYFPPPKEPPKE